MSIDIPSDTSAQNGHRDDRAQALSELLRIGTISIQGPSITMEHTDQSEYINSSGADDNMSASSYEEDSRGVFDNHVAETEPQNVGRVRPTTQTNCLETNVAPRIQHEPQVHQNQNVTAEDNPLQPTDAGDTESTMSNSVPYDVASMSLMSMSTGTLSSYFSNMSSEDSEAFAYEWIRLKTFSDWPLTSIFSTRLARNGWVSLGKGDRARCYSCNVVHEGWRIGDDPDQYHSPNCRFKDGQPNNVPISRATHPTPTLGKVSLLSTKGDGSSGNNPDPVQGELQPGLNRPQQECIPKETYSLSQETEGISSVVNNGNQNRIINQQAHKKNSSEKNVDHPKYPSYSNPAVRISSYTDWPAAMTQTPRDMALAGFFYAGYGDSTRCFFCGGGLRNWKAGDDPWVEHARWFPECPFIGQFRGQEFIDLVQKCETELKNQEEMERQQTNPPNDTDPPSLENYSNTDSHLNSNVDDQTSLDEHGNRNSLPNPIFDKRTSPKQENTILRNQPLCLTCMEKNVSIAFLPCGHLACCEDCAPAMRKCPICREFVRGTVRTFLA